MPCSIRPVIVHVIHSLDGGGTERTLVALLRAFDPSSFRHIVVTQRRAGALSAQLPDHVACRPLAGRGRSSLVAVDLARLLRKWKPAVVHARNTGSWADATIASMFSRDTQLVLGFHGLTTHEPLSSRRRRIARWGLRAGAGFSSVSSSGGRQLTAEAGIPPERIDILPNGVDLTRFQAPAVATRRRIRKELGLADESFVIGAVASLTPVKGHETLIKALAQITAAPRTVRLLIVGDGPLRDELRRLSGAEGVAERVVFAGWREDVPDLLAGVDAFVCSSMSEGMSNAVLEAMAAGLPVVATDVGDNGRLLRPGSAGLIVPPGDAGRLGAALAELISDDDLRRRLAVSARNRATAYDFRSTVRSYELYYARLASAGRREHRHGLRTPRPAQLGSTERIRHHGPGVAPAGMNPPRVESAPMAAVR